MAEHRPLLMVIDGHALAFRAFYALAEAGLRASNGEPAFAVFGFASIMLNAIDEHHPKYLAVTFDIGRTFRDDLYTEYKAGRAETPAEFEPQLARIKQMLGAFNIPIYTAEGYEADDVIGTLARQATAAGVETLILTGDTDTLQLVDSHVKVLLANPFGQRMSTKVYDLDQVTERYKGLQPNQLADLRGLKGDASDNIPGVKGIGEAGAIALLNQFGSIEGLYEHLAEAPKRYQKHLDGQREAAAFSKKLATIVCDAPVQLDLQAATLREYDRAAVIALFQELEMGVNLLKRLPASGAAVALAELPAAPGSTQQADMFAPVAGDGPQQMAMFDIPAATRAAATPSVPLRPAAGEYEAVRASEQLAEVVVALQNATALAFDTETTGISPMTSDLVGISLAIRPGHAWYLPVGHQDAPQLPREQVLDALRPFFADPQLPKYAHHAKFDIEVLGVAGVPVAGLTFDTMLAAALLDKRRGLKEVAFIELGKGKNQIPFDAVPIERATPDAAADADMTLRLQHALAPQIEAAGPVGRIFYDLEMPLIDVLVRMEQAGIGLDADYMRSLGRRLGERISTLEHEIHTIAKRPFNINSGDQLSDVLFGTIGLSPDGLAKTATGRISLTAAVLEDLRASDTSGMIDLILRYRQISKLKSTYVDALPDLVNPATGRVHTSYSQLGAATGRLASLDPNLQNIPTRTEEGREVRRGFVAAAGHALVAADYSQIELRVLAHITQDANLVRAFQENQDIHAATAAQLFGVAEHEVTKNQRRVAKTTVFGVIYGISAFGLAPRIGTSRSEAQSLIDNFFARFPAVREYIDRTLEDGRRDGYVQTLFGRRRSMPELRAGGARARAAEREAINHPIQGTAADIMKIAMIHVDQALRDSSLATRMLLQVHDELIFEAPTGEVAATVALVRERMEGAYALQNVPLRVEVESGPNWEELRPIE